MVELSPKSQRVAFAAALLVFAALSVPVMQDVLTAQVASRMRNTSEIRMQDDMRRTDPGTKYFMTKGTNWNSLYNGGAVGDDYHINERGQGTYALWYFTNVKSGDYNLDLTWPDVGVDLSDNLEIWVLDYAKGKRLYDNKDWAWILQQHPFSQEFAPSGQPDRSGISWERVNYGQDGVPVKLNILGGDIVYVLIRPKRQSNYIADAVRLVPVDNFVPPPPPIFEEIIIDNEDSRKIRFRPEDNWYSDIGDYNSGYDGSTHIYDGESSGTAYAVWNLNEVQQGNYTLYTTWHRDDIARNVNVLSYIEGEMDFETMDQSRMPSVEFDGNDSLWKRVMDIYIPPGDDRNKTALLYFWNRGDKPIIADAIMLVPEGMEPPSPDCEDYEGEAEDCLEAGCFYDEFLDEICTEERLECTYGYGGVRGYDDKAFGERTRGFANSYCNEDDEGEPEEHVRAYCGEGEYIEYESETCLNREECYGDFGCILEGQPVCDQIGSEIEGWYTFNDEDFYNDGQLEFIKDDDCADCKAECLNQGTNNEGWYSSCDEELIKYDNCSGEEEVYNIHVRGVLRDQMTSAPIGRAELTSPYEFGVYSTSPMIVETFTSGGMQIKKYYTNDQGVFDFLVRSDFRTNLENPEDNTSDESGWWNFKRGCYHWSGFGLRKGDDGDLELSKTIFDQSETWQSTDGRNFVNVHALPAYPFADIHLQSDQPVSFNTYFNYKNLDGSYNGGRSRLDEEQYLSTALPLDYDVHLTFRNENDQEFQTPVFHTPKEAMCKAVTFRYFNGEGEWSFCGNGEVEGTEDCDDGNDDDEDKCSNNCKFNKLCGDGIVQAPEDCDDGNSVKGDGCSATCEIEEPVCGNGVVETIEECDNGSKNSDTLIDACRTDCTNYRCGDSVKDTNEHCDDGNNNDNDKCSNECLLNFRDELCGDGILDHLEEQCDDGNLKNGDGCNAACKIEDGWVCEVGPSICPAECTSDDECSGDQVCVNGNCVNAISNATLSIEVKNIGCGDTAVENQKDIRLFRFEARASEAEDLLLTKIILDVDSGSLLNGQNYALWVDTDYNYNEDTISNVDTILEDGVSSQTQQVIFNNLAGGGFVIPDGQTVIFEVHTDIASSLTGDDLQVRFDADAGVVYLEAEILDDGSPMEGISTNGECENDTGCKIFVTTVESQNWNLRRQGNLFVTQSTVPLRNHQLLGGELGETILRLRFRADNEDIDVTDIQLTASGSTTSAEVDRLDLYREGQSWAFARATIGGCGNDDVLTTNPGGSSAPVNTFCANMETRQLVITGGTVMDVLVRPRLKTDVQGATSGQVIQFFIDKTNVSDEATGSGAIRARGDASSNNLSGNDGDYVAEGEVFIGTDTVGRNEFISGGKNISVMSEIVTITNASDDPSGTQVPIGLSDIGAFEFTAANHNNSKNGMNDAVLSGIILNVNATNVVLDASLGNFRLYNKADSTITQNCTAHANDGTILSGTVSGPLLVVCDGLEASSVDTNIDRGESITLILQGNITNQNNSTVGASSTLQVSIQNFDSIDRTRFSVNDNNASHIHWLDEDGEARNHFFWIEYPTTVIKSTSYSS